jgi:hypothetical protein
VNMVLCRATPWSYVVVANRRFRHIGSSGLADAF